MATTLGEKIKARDNLINKYSIKITNKWTNVFFNYHEYIIHS